MARWVGVAAVAASVAVGVLAAPRPAAAVELKCAYVMDIALPHAAVATITTERLSDTAKACKFTVTSKPARGVELKVELWVPVGPAWNGRYRQAPGIEGDTSGALRANAMNGFASAAVKMRGPGDAAAAAKETTDISNTLISALKGHPPAEPPPPPKPPAPVKPPTRHRRH
jgi:hypothetical protein